MIKMNKKNELTVEKGFEKFIKFCKRKNLSLATLEYYENNYNRFDKFLQRNNIELLIEINKTVIEEYIFYLQKRMDNPISINTYLRAIRSFLYYFMGEGYLKSFKITMLKADKPLKTTYTKQQLRKLLQKPNINKCNFAEYRNWVIINFFMATGLRLKSVINIQIKDLDLEEEKVIIRKTKNRISQILPLSKTMIDIFYEYLEKRGGEEEEYLFPTIYGERMAEEGLDSAIERYNIKRGVSLTSIHAFRHTFSKMFIINGGSIGELKTILGHKSLKTTDDYVRLLVGDIKESFISRSPLESLVGQKRGYIKLK